MTTQSELDNLLQPVGIKGTFPSLPSNYTSPPSPPPSTSSTPPSTTSELSRSNSFIALLKAAEKPPCAEKDAGNKSEIHYKSRLPLWRFKLRNALLPIIRWETPHLAKLQTSIRNPLLDVYFALSANLGTHTFYVIMLPVSYWYGGTELARHLTFILSLGVYITGFVKDLLCLPRPLSPPLHRITMSGSAALEYGFPSTHTANAVGVYLLLTTRLFVSRAEYDFYQYLIYQFLNFMFVFSIVVGRLYCGMHGFSDVIIGAVIGGGLWSITVIYPTLMNDLRTTSSYWPLLVIPATLTLVRIHPEPADDCPCFDDGVAFLGVLMGEVVGQWLLSNFFRHDYGTCKGCIPYNSDQSGIIGSLLRFVFGVGMVVTWRHHMKRILHDYLPPVFRFVEKIGLTMPRKYFIPASQYQDVPQSIPDITLFETHEITSLFSRAGRARSDSVGPQSPADLYESLAYRESQKKRNEKNELNNTLKEEDYSISKGTSSSVSIPGSAHGISHDDESNIQDDLMSTVVIPRVRYDVEVITKLIVYCGIAFIAVFLVDFVFYFLGI